MNSRHSSRRPTEVPDVAEFIVLIPARMASVRLPDKPLADIGGQPMIVRVAQRAALSRASQIAIAADDPRVIKACSDAGFQALATRTDHPSGSDRLAEVCELLKLPDDTIVVNVQGDEPLIDAALINGVAETLAGRPDCVMATIAHPIAALTDFLNPNVVKVVLDKTGAAQYFSRAPIPWVRDATTTRDGSTMAMTRATIELTNAPEPSPLRHVGIYAYRVGFLKTFPTLEPAPTERLEALEQLRVMWHGHRIAVLVSNHPPKPGVDTPADLERVRDLWEADESQP
jgi:3-deoxy-manno-octulosonate cytidylyltransferase (CMP-KDO synthetase)